MKKHYRKENDCLNCGTVLEGKFCHNCGQENLELKESFGHMMNHAVSDYFHFDDQFFHTLKPLLFKPGFLTNEYLAGRRARYLHPVKMYIFISIVYFLLLFQSGAGVGGGSETPVRVTRTAVATKSVNDKKIDSAKKLVTANAFIPVTAKKEIVSGLDKEKAADIDGYQMEVNYEKQPNRWFHPTTMDTSYAEYLANQKKLAEEKQHGFFERMWNKKVFSYREKYGNGAKDEFLDDVKHNVPKMMFLLLPLFALIIGITFRRNKKFYVEHLIYTFHLFCFLFLFLGFIILLQMPTPHKWVVVNGAITFLATLYIGWYVYRSLRVVYQRNRFRTATKAVGMGLTYSIVFFICISLYFILIIAI